MLLDSVAQECRYTEDDLSVLCDVWSLGREDLHSGGLGSPGSVATPVSGAWTGRTQSPGSADSVDQRSCPWFLDVAWTPSQQGSLRIGRLVTGKFRAPGVGILAKGKQQEAEWPLRT